MSYYDPMSARADNAEQRAKEVKLDQIRQRLHEVMVQQGETITVLDRSGVLVSRIERAAPNGAAIIFEIDETPLKDKDGNIPPGHKLELIGILSSLWDSFEEMAKRWEIEPFTFTVHDKVGTTVYQRQYPRPKE